MAAVGDKITIRPDASSTLAGKTGTLVDTSRGGTNRYVSRDLHYKVAFDEPVFARDGLWFDADEVEA